MRRDARIKAFALVFEKLFHSCDEFDGQFVDELTKAEDREFTRSVVDAFEEHKIELEEKLCKYLTGYEVGRVYKVDLALLYTALIEIFYLKTPYQVAINEALEIAKVYSTEKSSKFIHGVLSAIIKGEEIK